MDISDGMDKSWNHPWTTEEMRKKRREWSLAGDAGLLKHLQQFSENLVSKANKTDEALNSLTTQLNEAAILIDNVTNTSLALANTQFIESRVQEDDIVIEKKETVIQESKNEDLATADLIATVSESIREGLDIMDSKYKKTEFVDSDSEEENNGVVLSVVLGPNDPYQDRPLPYVTGSEQWKNSSKIGLESSSSSESEQVDEEDEEDEDEDEEEEEEESESDDDQTGLGGYNIDTGSKSEMLIGSDYSKRSDISYMENDKLDVISHNNVHSVSESITPNDNTPKVPLPNNLTPNFAEELAKRLGTVRQTEKPAIVDEKSEASINRFKDGDENVLNDKSKNVFSGNAIPNDQTSGSLWKGKPIKPYENNIIPASIDVPPPISTVSTKPKSAIDDLFADADSEDSDDIFSSKNTVKTITKNKHPSNSNVNTETAKKKYLDIVAPSVTDKRATSTPENNVKDNLFVDDDDDDLFGSSKNPTIDKKKPMGEVSILGDIITSDMKNKLSNRIMRTQSSESSGSDTPPKHEGSQKFSRDDSWNTISKISNDNNVDDWSPIVMGVNNAENLAAPYESSNSSGISINPPSVNNTKASSIGPDFQPLLTSTRLKSEEIYRENIANDSLFASNSVTSNPNAAGNQPQEEVPGEPASSTQENDVFENDEELFSPPPLPKLDSKPPKSKVSFLFDDSDSGDELFSTTSSGSRSQKSTDFLTAVPQYSDKAKATQRRGLFDEDIDIFGNKDSPDVDIFGIASKAAKEESGAPAKKLSATPKKISLFDDAEDMDDGDLFSAKPIKSDGKTESKLFDEDDGDLFSVKKAIDRDQANAGIKQPLQAPPIEKENVEQMSTRKTERKLDDILSGNGFFSAAVGSHGLIFEDDDYDDLFSSKIVTKDTNEASAPDNKDDTKTLPAMASKVASEVPNQVASFENAAKLNLIDTSGVERSTEKEDFPVTSNAAEISEVEPKRSPPRSLDIHVTMSSSPPEENSQSARRTVSGKIKNLMGKMGDLKILSPMDTPPLWRRSEERTDEEDSVAGRDSDDGGCVSTQGHSSPPSVSEDSTAQKQSLQSTVSGESNVESAISFDEPAQVETLSTAASKTRVRIQAKRRPQSRHARKSALRQSGIDFDTVDASGNNSQDESHVNKLPSTLIKEPSNFTNANVPQITSSDRLVPSSNDNLHRLVDPNMSLAADEKSELGSISKESSMSANKNTLLSPSTDEEDLFDVPPDLPEDPQKEDTLFGRGPILSPVDRVLSEKPVPVFKPLKDTHIKTIDHAEVVPEKKVSVDHGSKLAEADKDLDTKVAVPCSNEKEVERDNVESKEESKEMIDPLRDSSHDPLKDPSQLFAFVTKTPSPEKGKNLLFSEDDSLFSTSTKRPSDDQTAKKQMLDLFADDTEGDLFSSTLSKPVKKPLKDTMISLFDDDGQDDEDDSLFEPVVKKLSGKAEPEKKQENRKNIGLFDDGDDDTILFSEQSEHTRKSDTGSVQEPPNKKEIFANITESVKTSHITDIFAEQSSGEDDIFASKIASKKVVASKFLFSSDDDDDDAGNIFRKKSSTSESRTKPIETRSTAVKKSVTRDLKKTAEKISEDPLSILQDD
ncbi:PWP1 homolog no child left behind isoform X2 [Nomia melanderi]|uniref:PWP1 homolog no child left behind isoform X2 n=1 Tax=Nomia melanderi TaxID=2448451 RepID=UPI00130462AA|nr:WASH complex subunit 2 isoform X2 [Nomia melanderi]